MAKPVYLKTRGTHYRDYGDSMFTYSASASATIKGQTITVTISTRNCEMSTKIQLPKNAAVDRGENRLTDHLENVESEPLDLTEDDDEL